MILFRNENHCHSKHEVNSKKHDAYLLTDSEKNSGNLNEFGRILINWYQVESAAFALCYTGIFTLEYFIIMRNQI